MNIIKSTIRQARDNVQSNMRIEVEVETLSECEYALDEKADVIMLDNMPPEDVRKAVAMRDSRGLADEVLIEVSGGVGPQNVREYADAGADMVSSGSLTNCVRALDFSLEVILKK